MKQYNYKTTGAMFCEYDYGPKHDTDLPTINVVYTNGIDYTHAVGWVKTHEEAAELVAEFAAKFGVQIIGCERVI